MTFRNRQHYKNYLSLSNLFFFICVLSISAFSQKAQDLYKRGLKEKSLEQKIAYLTQAIQADPTFTNAYYELGLAYKAKGELEQALLYLGKTLIANPPEVDTKLRFQVVYETGLIQRTLGQLVQARESFLAAKRLSSDSKKTLEILYLLGELYIDLGQIDKALSTFLEGYRLAPDDNRFQTKINQLRQEKQLYSIYAEGVKHLTLNRFAEAIAAFEKVLAIQSDFKDAQQKLAEAKEKLRTQKQIESKKDLEQLYTQGVEFMNRGQLEEASLRFQEILETNPNHQEAQNKISEVNSQQAPELAEDQPETATTELAQLYESALSNYQSGNWNEAIREFEQLLRINPSYRDAAERLSAAKTQLENQELETVKLRLYQSAQAAIQDKDWVAAVAYLEQLLNLAPGYRNTAELLSHAKKFVKATPEINGEDELYEKGIHYLQEENFLEAIIAFEKVTLIDPDYKNVRALLAEAKGKLNSKTLPTANKVQSSSSFSLGYVVLGVGAFISLVFFIVIWLKPIFLADFYYKQKRWDKAALIYEKIWNKNHSNADVCLKLAQIYHQQKREDKSAIQVYENIIRMDLDTPIKGDISTIVAYHYLSEGNPDNEKIEILEKVLNNEINRIKSTKG